MDNLSLTRKRIIQALVWAIITIFALTTLWIFAHDFLEKYLESISGDSFLFLIGALFALGAILFIETWRSPLERMHKRFLLLMSGSIIAVVLGIVLHNFMYALATLAEDMRALHAILGALEVGFFLAAIFVFPVTFLIGAIGVIVLMVRDRTTPHPPTPHNLHPTD